MALGLIARLVIHAGKSEEFEAGFKKLQTVVANTEAGNRYYELHKSRNSDNTYIVMEQYDDQPSLDLHGKSEEFKAASAAIGGCLASTPQIEIMDVV
ncbi:MAG: quinol monooxygenase YgiN [Flavobacterium sp.]|jgi:quinol monooxygenase YgiN